MPTLIDIAKMNGADAEAGLIEESIQAHPEIGGLDPQNNRTIPNVGDSRTIVGTQYKTLVRTGVPTVGFRSVNQGTASAGSSWANKLIECFIMNPRFEADRALALAHEDGPEAYLALEGAGQLEGAMRGACKQFYYGLANDAKGFPGLIDIYDATNMVVDAVGTTANTGSSLWAVKYGPQHVRWVFGRDGKFQLEEPREESIVDSGGTNRFTAFIQEMLMWLGLQVGTNYSIGRIKKLTADSGTGLTDARIAALLAKFPVGIRPDVLFCSRRSLYQLQASRTATTATGTPAPIPTESHGVPIAVTDSILDTEALTL